MPFIMELLKQNKLKLISFLLFSFITSAVGVLTLVFINDYLLKNAQNIPIFYFIVLLLIFFISSTIVELGLSIFGQNFIFKMQRRVVKQILDTPLLRVAKVGKARILASLGSDVRNISFGLLIKNNKIYAKPKEKLIIFASTHKDEEELLLDYFKLEENEKLIIAPRHPERFKEVENLLLNKGLEFEKFSSLKDENKKFSKKILLLDALGELVNFYAISDVVVLGGSFIEGIGGHNPIEAAYFDNVLISGKFIHNQKVLFEEVENVYFCEKLKDLNDKIHYLNLKAKISKKENLDLIIQTIQKGIDARKSL